MKKRKRQEEQEKPLNVLLRLFTKHKGWIGTLVYPFFLCLSLTVNAQSQQSQALLNLDLKPGQAPPTPKTLADLNDIYYQNLHDVFFLIFHESDSSFEALAPLEEVRLDAIESFKSHSPWKSFLEAEIKLQWAFLKLKYGEEWGAFWSLRSANKTIQENLKTYPEFPLNHRTNGLLNILFGVTPDNYKWVFNLFGMKGTVKEGIELLRQSQDTKTVFGLESKIILGMVYSHLLEEIDEAPLYIEKHQLSSTALAKYFQGIILQKSHKAKEARLLWLSEEVNIPFRSYLIAESYFQEADYKSAIIYFNEFLKSFGGKTYQKDALLKISLAHHFLGNDQQYKNFLFQAQKSDANSSEVDKNAQKILESIESLNFELIQLRYAVDGGFYGLAEQLLQKIDASQLTKVEKVELVYREARMAHLKHTTDKAIKLYTQVIDEAETVEGSYFAPNAFLQLGYLQRQLGNLEEAKLHFEKVLNYKKHPYKNSLDSKAKVALSLLGLAGE